MNMSVSNDPIYLEVLEVLEAFRKRISDRIAKGHQKQKECKIQSEIETKMAQEAKLNMDLRARLTEISRKGDDLDKVCANFASGITISDSDQNRLDNAREMFVIAKKLTGVRFDFSAPPNVAKGYIKSESRRTLCPFELEAPSEDAMWALLQLPQAAGKENRSPN